ncbi:MAG: hypothetical protein KTR31_18605 [Myxococcales bacterium]|nr:hypothetical protein [Myxococcales bacterium]
MDDNRPPTSRDTPFAPPKTESTSLPRYRDLEPHWRIMRVQQLSTVGMRGIALVLGVGVPALEVRLNVPIAAVYLLLELAGLVLWTSFHLRALRNLRALGTGADQGLAVHLLSWFAPVANLFIPRWSMRELLFRSTGAAQESGGWRQVKGDWSIVVDLYWSAYVGAWVLSALSGFMSDYSVIDLFALGFTALAVVRYLGLTNAMVEGQRAMAEHRGRTPTGAPDE